MRYLYTLTMLLFVNILVGQAGSKIGGSLVDAMDMGDSHEVMVIMDDQVKLSTTHLSTKAEKAEYVYTSLAQVAMRSQQDIGAYLDAKGVDFHSFNVVNALSLTANNQLIRELASRPDVRKVIHDPWFKVDLPVASKPLTSYRMADTTYGIKLIGADIVWEQGFTGQGVTVAGQDTGYDWDVDPLRSKYRGWNATDSTADHNYHWYDAIHEISPLNNDSLPDPANNPCGVNSLEPCDDENHGTHTMGTMVGGTAENAIGVAPDANWIGCRSLERGWGKLSTYTECFEFFLAPTDLQGQNPEPSLAPHVINNSWYCPAEEGCTPETWEVMEIVMFNLKASGVMIVVSAGNSGPTCGTIVAPPAIFNTAFTVGAVSEAELIAEFSSRGPVLIDTVGVDSFVIAPHVVAPGVDVISVVRNGVLRPNSGTSMSGPHVAGMVALMISAVPELAGDPAAIEHTIMNTTKQKMSSQDCNDVMGQGVPNAVYGHGIVNVADAVYSLIGVSSTEDIANAGDLLVYPNPTTGLLSFSTAEKETITTVSIFDLSGRVVAVVSPRAEVATIDISGFANGLYIYAAKTSKALYTGKVNKQ